MDFCHVMYKMGWLWETRVTNQASTWTIFLEMCLISVRLGLLLAIKVFIAELALCQISHVYGCLSVSFNMQVKMLHELQVIHEELLAHMAFECHVCLKFTVQNRILSLQITIVITLKRDKLLGHLHSLVHTFLYFVCFRISRCSSLCARIRWCTRTGGWYRGLYGPKTGWQRIYTNSARTGAWCGTPDRSSLFAFGRHLLGIICKSPVKERVGSNSSYFCCHGVILGSC